MAHDPDLNAASAADLPRLFAQLAGQLLRFVEDRVRLAEEEWQGHLHRVKTLSFGIGVALAATFIGLELVTVGVIIWVGTFIQPLWLVFLAVGAAWVGGGLFFVWRLGRELIAPRRIFRHSEEEFEKDRAWVAGRK